jgi:enamine deaminase RidA (YjgF/YER057c/UK114 family)
MPITHVNPDGLHRNPAFSWAVRVPAGHDTVYVGGQNGVGPDGTVVGPGLGEQTRQALANLRTCLEAAGASTADVVKWTILCVEGSSLQEGFAAFGEVWPRDAPPPAITFAFVAGLAVPGALVEIEAVAAVPA